MYNSVYIVLTPLEEGLVDADKFSPITHTEFSTIGDQFDYMANLALLYEINPPESINNPDRKWVAESSPRNLHHNNQKLEEENHRLKETVVKVTEEMAVFGRKVLVEKRVLEEKLELEKVIQEQEIEENKAVQENFGSPNNKLFFTDELWKVVITIMSGIEMSVRVFDFDKMVYEPLAKDFELKNTFQIHHASLDQYKFAQFVDFAPLIFHYLRKMSGVFPENYLESLGSHCLSKAITGSVESFEGLSSSGKSGSFFFTSHDKKYMVKTIKTAEFNLIMNILPEYFAYVTKYKENLLNKILGLHRIVMKNKLGIREEWTIIVMENIFCTNKHLKLKFDLKGSTYKRFTK
jgi:1-phosphatidylinositol-4-phosphate 5-kinase